VRKQFNLPIAKFEGIEEPLARIGALTYAMDAARVLTAGAVDAGERPSVASAIVKCYLTEGMRRTINDAMDIVGGAGICRGPRNVLAGAYAALPIGITVEGANILTRSMIIFGQGAIRCHPFVQAEMRAAFDDDLDGFDRAFFGHIGFVFRNVARNVVHALTGGFLAPSPVPGAASPYYRGLTRMSAAFALASDVAMGTLGGALKRKEKITGRLADVLAWMYLASAALKRFHDEGSKARDLPFVRWFCEHALYEAQEAYLGVLRNLPFRPAAWFLRALAFPFGRRFAPPSDRLGHQVAAALVDGGEAREHLTGAMYVPPEDERGLGVLEDALAKVVRAQAVHAKIGEAVKAKRLERKPTDTLVERAHAAGIVTDGDRAVIAEAEAARSKAIAVDAFAQRKYAEMSA
jgi:acyl-CoA dehydrogenase